VEVVVADNASTDRTGEIARSRGCRVVHVGKRVIAAARNGGAMAARAEVLAFVDADSLVHPGTFDAIDRALGSGRVAVGATGVRMSRLSPPIALMYMLMVPTVWLAGLDTGVVFCRREDWAAIGGYNEKLLVAEDVRFLLDLKRLGRRRGQGFARLRAVKAIASTRKFDKHGDWRFLAGMLLTPLLFVTSRAALERLVRRYWYEDRA